MNSGNQYLELRQDPFFQYNSKPGIALPILKTIDGSDWINLRELKLFFMRGDDSDESGGDKGSNGSDENYDAESNGSDMSALDTISPKVKANKFTGVANLIQKNRSLQALHIDSPEQNRSTYLKSLAPLTLDTIRSHPSPPRSRSIGI